MGLASTYTDIANMALRILGESFVVANVDSTTDTDIRTVALKDAYLRVLYAILRRDRWNFSTRFVDLVLLKENPTDEWTYAYRYPTSAIQLRRILSGYRNDAVDTSVKHKIVSQASSEALNITAVTKAAECTITSAAHGLEDGDLVDIASVGGMTQLNGNEYIVADAETNTFAIKDADTGEYVDSTGYTTYTSGGTATPKAFTMVYCDLVDAQAEITAIISDVSLYPSDFVDYYAAVLAVEIGPLVMGPERSGLIDRAIHLADERRKIALGNSCIEVVQPNRPPSKYLRARQGCA